MGSELRTSALVAAMVADLAATGRPRTPVRWVNLAAVAGAFAAASLVLVLLGPRDDAWALVAMPAALKLLVPLVLAGAGLTALGRLIHPEGEATLAVAVLPGLAILAVGLAAELGTVPVAGWRHLAWHGAPLSCAASVASLGILPLALLLAAARRGAVTRPVRAGALAGLVAGASGAAAYALWCPVDSVLYFTIWYLGGTALVVALGAAVGSWALRWSRPQWPRRALPPRGFDDRPAPLRLPIGPHGGR